MTNYWGYSTRSASSAPDLAFREQVPRPAGARVQGDGAHAPPRRHRGAHRRRHHNHSCEGDHEGPIVSLRGIDNSVYYRLKKDQLDRYEDFTVRWQHARRRAPADAQARHGQPPLLGDGDARRRSFASRPRERARTRGRAPCRAWRRSSTSSTRTRSSRASSSSPSPGTWARAATRSATFPSTGPRWNGKFRDTVRRFWKGDAGPIGDLGYRLTGSSDLYQDDGRHPSASINFVTAHDGFTLRDLVSYEEKHNEGNGEDNRDGATDNASSNSGVEGDTIPPSCTPTAHDQPHWSPEAMFSQAFGDKRGNLNQVDRESTVLPRSGVGHFDRFGAGVMLSRPAWFG